MGKGWKGWQSVAVDGPGRLCETLRMSTDSGRGPMNNRTTFTAQARAEFLEELAVLGSANAAAAAAGISESVARYHRDADPDFAEECQRALDRHHRMLMQVVKKLGVDGVEEPIFDRLGVEIGKKKRYSERMLLAWLARQETGSWAQRGTVKHEHTGEVKHTGRIEVEQLTAEQQRHARRFLQSLEN